MRLRGTIAFLSGLLLILGVGWFVFPLALYETIEQPLQFNHDAHTGEEKAGMACEDCHSFREDGTFAGIPRLENCAGCHSEAQGESASERMLIERHINTNSEIPWLVYSRQPDNVYFSHVQHVRLAEIGCERCHGPHGQTASLRPYQRNRISGYSRDIWGSSISGIAATEWDGMKMDDCVACHAERGVVDSCLLCHK